MLLFDAFNDNFQYFILKNYENAYCYKEYNVKLFDTTHYNSVKLGDEVDDTDSDKSKSDR